VTRTEQFDELRPLLFAIAYRILGSVSDAEDAVQDTWLRYESSATEPTSPKAFLSAVVTRLSIDVLRSARVRREVYVGNWFPEPLVDDPYDDPARSAELADSVSMASLLLLERLSQVLRVSADRDEPVFVGDAAVYPALETPIPMSRHHDQIGAGRIGRLDDRLSRRTDLHQGIDIPATPTQRHRLHVDLRDVEHRADHLFEALGRAAEAGGDLGHLLG